MVKAEKAFKWGIAIIAIFGILNAFYFLNLVVAFKIVLPILCVFMIGSILLQSGKGGGLAAIGGLGDQSAFGTRTSTFLSKVTYLIGAAFIVATIFLFKLSIPTKAIDTTLSQEFPEAQHTHEHPGHDERGHGDVTYTEGKPGDTSAAGMQNVAEEASNKPAQESPYHQAGMKSEASQDQAVGMNPVQEEGQTSDATKRPVTEEKKETGGK